ncbi:MAG: beta-propeller fold lactonase family protein [Parafilimonas sp.]
MKHKHLTLATLAISLIAFNSCKKENIANVSKVSESATSESLASTGEGVVYTMDNAAAGNNVLVFKRATNGGLTNSAIFPTGGTGTGAGLGSQGAMVADKKQHLFVCNAASNNITVFKINGWSLMKIDKISSHGTMPISVTVHDDLLYVLNAGDAGNISGFRIYEDGHLEHISGSNRKLSTDTSGPAQIEFNHAGTQLVVTEKATNRILTYAVQSDGTASSGTIHSSAGTTPFGFEFGKNNELIVSDAFGGAPNKSALSSYKLNNSGGLTLITGPVATNQTAACWVAVTDDSRFCYTTNTGSNSISGYYINDDGKLKLLDANGITAITGVAPIDMALSKESKFLYALNSGSGSISAYKVTFNGGLNSLGDISDIPLSAAGLVAW